jgi:hypothetical protein
MNCESMGSRSTMPEFVPRAEAVEKAAEALHLCDNEEHGFDVCPVRQPLPIPVQRFVGKWTEAEG